MYDDAKAESGFPLLSPPHVTRGPGTWWGWPWLAALAAGRQLDLWELRASTRARVRREEGTEGSESRRLGRNCKYSHWLPEAVLPRAGAVAPPCSGSADVEAGALQTLGEAAGNRCSRVSSGRPPHICLRHDILPLRNAKSILPGVGARCFCIFDFSYSPLHPAFDPQRNPIDSTLKYNLNPSILTLFSATPRVLTPPSLTWIFTLVTSLISLFLPLPSVIYSQCNSQNEPFILLFFYWDTIDIKDCVSLRFIMCGFDTFIYCGVITTANTCIESHYHHFLFVVGTTEIRSLSNFEVHSTVLLSIVTIVYTVSPGLIYRLVASFYVYTSPQLHIPTQAPDNHCYNL